MAKLMRTLRNVAMVALLLSLTTFAPAATGCGGPTAPKPVTRSYCDPLGHMCFTGGCCGDLYCRGGDYNSMGVCEKYP
jgi:hypothetical protein